MDSFSSQGGHRIHTFFHFSLNSWDKVYDREVINFEDHGDIGEIWYVTEDWGSRVVQLQQSVCESAVFHFVFIHFFFSFCISFGNRFGEDSAVKMVDWVEEHYEDEMETTSILDLGCGNGHLLLDLAELGFEDLTGIDYSPAAIRLATAVAKDREFEDIIQYAAVDFLAEKETLDWCSTLNKKQEQQQENETQGPKKFKVMLDKGTYDAISLHQKNKRDAAVAAAAAAAAEESETSSTPEEKKTDKDGMVLAENDDNMEELAERYPKRVAAMMQDDGRLLITSCNWTQAELIQRFAHGKKEIIYRSVNGLIVCKQLTLDLTSFPFVVFEYDSHLKYPTFTFGGVKGQTISSVVFKKKGSSS